MKTTIPKGAFVIAGIGLLGLWLWRRNSANAAAAAADPAAGWPIGAVPASFSYITSAAPAPTDTPIGGLNAADSAALAMLQQLTARLAGGGGGAQMTSGGTVAVAAQRHPLISGGRGDVAGRPGENRFTFASPSDNTLWAFHGGWQGPGVYEAQKFTDPSHGNTTGTELVRVG